MTSKSVRCTVVEVPVDHDGEPLLDAAPRDLLPWADPYIAALLAKHRLQAALDDSLRFVENEVAERGPAWSRFQSELPPDSSRSSHSSFD
jgi:hypothetical protein